VLASLAVQTSAKAQINLQRTVFAVEGLGVDDLEQQLDCDPACPVGEM
jgi:hypothetical protein